MEIFVIIVAFWLILVGAYGALTLMGNRAEQARSQMHGASVGLPKRPAPLGEVFSEVDMLRAQVEHLRTEVVALSETATRHERPRTRRYQTGVYADLPRMLRRHVKEARSERNPLGI
jgi:hypothetical protein